ncbi:MAG TPA: class I SAM-dependent methyltransferase [Leptolyngbyaceae cyanobacterium]
MKVKVTSSEKRSFEQLKEHYEIEKELAGRLRDSTKEERQWLYTKLYDELYRKVPHHSQLTRKYSPEDTAWIVAQRMQLLERYLSTNKTYLEIGPGDCNLAIAVSKQVKKVYAVDVSTEITKQVELPPNLDFVLSDGCSIPVPENSVDVAYSHQLMEHLHPDDALDQLQNIYKALSPQGIYICITPNRLSGPHDISRYFDETATGFHLKEYTLAELYELFCNVGFTKVIWVKNNKNHHIEITLNQSILYLIKLAEKILDKLPFSLRNKIASTPLLFRGMTVIGVK